MATFRSIGHYAFRQIAAFVLVDIGLAMMASGAYAGECTEGIAFYVQRLEHLSRQNPPDIDFDVLSCLSCHPEDPSRWAGRIAAKRFAECRNSPFRNRIAAACVVYLNNTTGGVSEVYAERAALLLAFYGFNKIGDYDIFQALTSGWRVSGYPPIEKLMALAALQDRRTVTFLSEIYDTLQTGEVARHGEYIAGILNCLYHIPGDDAVELAERIYKETVDMHLRERAQRVISR